MPRTVALLLLLGGGALSCARSPAPSVPTPPDAAASDTALSTEEDAPAAQPSPDVVTPDATAPDVASPDAAPPDGADVGTDLGASPSDAACGADGAADAGCYASACPGTVHTLQANRDRLIADLARRKCTTACGLWAALNQA